MRYSLSEVKEKCKRDNKKANDKLHWFSSKFSIYFSYIFINLRLNADHVTIIFFIIGLLGSISYGSSNISFIILGYILFRLHIIFDMCDGDVARFNKSFSIRGAYWDSMIHSALNPLYYLFFCISLFNIHSDSFFLLISPFLTLSMSLNMSVKNNFLKAKFQNKDLEIEKLKINNKSRFGAFNLIAELTSIEGFVFLAIPVFYFQNLYISKIFVIAYLLFNISKSFIKFILLSYKGAYYNRN